MSPHSSTFWSLMLCNKVLERPKRGIGASAGGDYDLFVV
jgi:hypothetical protein